MFSGLKNTYLFFFLVFLLGIIIFFNQDNILFWDTIQFAGKHGLYFYENGLSKGILLPDAIDSGHPPFFGIFLSFAWKIFGRSLMVSHWLIFPFLVGILYYAFKISEHFIQKDVWVFPLMLFVCPFFLGHSILVSPDIILLLGFMMSVYGIGSKRPSTFIFGSILLVLISLRGMALLAPIAAYEIYLSHGFNIKSIWKRGLVLFWKYIPAITIAVLFLAYHYFEKGWVAGHEDSPWAPSFQNVGFRGMLKNGIFFIHRMLDLGMLMVYAVVFYKWKYLALLKGRLIWLWLFMAVVLMILILPYQGLLNHRYFLPLNLIALVLGAQVLRALNKKWLTYAVITFLGIGNCWVYPDEISQGWDSTFAHQGYYREVEDFQKFIKYENISPSDVGTVFPIKGDFRFKNLEGDSDSYQDFHNDNYTYILYSNIMNDFSDEEIKSFESKEVIYQSKTRGVKFVLYKK